jgi:ATP-dependent Clp protease ATP-binding subunit ClpA
MPESTGPLLLPGDVASSADLSWEARQAPSAGGSPFDGSAGYDRVFDALARALHRRHRPHALVVAEPGVGALALVAELARRAATGRAGFLAAKRFLSVDARYTPADESRARLVTVLAHTAHRSDLVVYLDGLPALLAGRDGPHKPVLLGALAAARFHLIAPLTPDEYDDLAGGDSGFADFFSRVEVPEPDPDTALPVVAHLAAGLAAQYGLTLDGSAVRQAVSLTADYVLSDHLPAKALKVLTRACEDADYDRRQLGRPVGRVAADDVTRVVAERTGIPADTLRGAADRTDYEAALGGVVFGQDHAVREVATELGLIRAGMTDPTKPASVLLFLGQTGTGKTELAKTLARFYSSSGRLRTYALGNCVEPHSVATIIGVPPGYVGSDRPGRLVADLQADPYGVFLLDEADKAHPDVLQPFLNLFDEGWVTDQRGAKAHGTRSVFVLTTNVGQRMIADMHREGKSVEEITGRMKEALGQIRHGKSDRPVFTPEFLARVKRVIVFRPLDRAAMVAVARKQLTDVRQGWAAARGKELGVSDALAEYVGAAAHRLDQRAGGKEGGRVVRKLVSDWVEAPLLRAMAADPDGYREARAVVIDFGPHDEPENDHPYPTPMVSVRFEFRVEADG